MTTSGKKFIQRETKNPLSLLTTGTNKSPEPIKITTKEAQTVSEAVKKQTPKSSAIQTASMTPATQTQKQKVEREYRNMTVEAEEYNKVRSNGKYEKPLLSKAVNIPREIEARFVTAGTQGWNESRQQAENQAWTTSNIYKNILGQQDETQQKRSDTLTVTNPYISNFAIETNIDFSELRTNAGSIGDVLPDVTLNADGTRAYLTNGTTTVAKPVIKVTDYDGLLNNAYNAVTYEYYTNGNLPSAEDFKNVFPEYKDVSDQEVDRFINECAYDVENGERRDISMYAENFVDLSMPDGYTSKHDSILSLYSDTNYITYGLAPYMSGTKTLEGRTPEQVREFVEATNMMHAYVDVIKEKGANIDGASDYVIAKQFADEIPELKKAVETYEKFNLKTEEFLQFDFAYNAAMNDMKSFVENIEGLSGIEYEKLMTEYTHQYLQEFNNEFMNSWNKERLQGGILLAGEGRFDSMIYGNSYEVNGKYYDKNGNEIPQDDVHIGIVNRYLETLGSIPYQIDEINFDSQIAAMQPWGSDKRKEMNADVLFDSINLAFASAMSFTQGGILFQGSMELPFVGTWIESLFDMTLEFLGAEAGILGNMIGFTDGRSEESKKKYEDAVGGLTLMLLGGVKGRIKEKFKRDLDNKAFIKATKEFVRTITDRYFEIDTKPVSEVIEKKLSKLEEEVLETGEKPTTEKTEAPKIITTREIIREGIKAFNETFEKEYQKAVETESTSIIDDLFQTARTLFGELTQERTNEIKDVIKGIQEKQGSTVQTEPQTGVGTPSETTTQPTESPEISVQEGTMETVETPQAETVQPSEISTPGVKVEETKTGSLEIAEGEAETTNARAEETKNTITKILDVMQKIRDNANEMYEKIVKGSEQKQIENRMKQEAKLEDYMVWDEKIFTPEEYKIASDNPFSPAILRIVDALTSVRTNKKGKPTEIIQNEKATNDKIQREVLSDGLTKIQKYVDRINELRKRIGELYNKLSDDKTIRTRDFIKSDPFQRLLKENGLEYIEWIDEKGNVQRAVVADNGRVLKASERAVVKYLENMIDLITEKSRISEKDAHATRTNFTTNGDWDKSGDFPSAIKKRLYNAWNEFLDSQGRSEMMRKLDEGFAQLSENLDVLSELLDKKNTDELKNNAKNTILKWDDETISQMNKLFPGIDKLIELTKASPELVRKTIDAKTKYKDTRKLISNRARYGGVMLASTIATSIPGGIFMKLIFGSLGFVTIEKFGNYLKGKIGGKKIDRSDYNKIVDMLNIDGNEKSKLKQSMLDSYKTISELSDLKTDIQMQNIMEEASQILIDRQAEKIRRKKQAELEAQQMMDEARWRNYLREKGVGDTTPKLPESTQGGVVATDTFTLPQDRGVKETYKDKEKTQQGYTQAESTIMQASLGKEEGKTYSPEAEKVADAIESVIDKTAEAIEQDATNKVIEKGEELTDENIEKEINKEPSAMDDFIAEIEAGASDESLSKDYDNADIKVLEKVVNNPGKYPNVDYDAAVRAYEKAINQNIQADMMQSPDQQQAQREIAGIYKGNQMELEHNKGWEKQREDMVRETNRDFDSLETTEEYDRIEKGISPEQGEMAIKYTKGYKGYYRSEKAKTDLLLEDMGMGPSQNITYTSSSDKIATLKNPTSRKRVAEQRIRQKVDPSIKNAKSEKTKSRWIDEKIALDKIIEQANIEIQAQKDLLEQKKDLVKQRKALEKKRDETPYPETKKEITKQIEKIEQEFESLIKPKEVEEMEVNEAYEQQEFNRNMEENETPQINESIGDREQYIANKFNERYGANESPEFRQKATDLIQKIKENKEAKNRKELRKNLEKLDKLVSDKVDEGIVEMQFFLDKWNKEFDVEQNETPQVSEETQYEGNTKPQLNQGEVKGEMIHVTPEEFEEFREGDTYNEIDRNTNFGTFVTDDKIFLDNFKKVDEDLRGVLRGGKQRKEKILDVDLKKVALHPAGIADVFGYGREAEKILLDYLEEVGRLDINMQKDLIGLKKLSQGGKEFEDFDFNTYPWKENYTKEEILDMDGNIYAGLAEDRFEGGETEEMIFGQDAKEDAEILKKKGYDAVKFYEGRTEAGHSYSYALFDPNKFIRRETKKETSKKEESPKGNMMANVKMSEEYGVRESGEAATPGDSPLLFVEKDGTIHSTDEIGLGDVPTYKIEQRIDFLKKKRADNGKKLYAKEMSELRFLQDLLKRQKERENREEGGTELSDRQREILNSNNYGDVYNQSKTD